MNYYIEYLSDKDKSSGPYRGFESSIMNLSNKFNLKSRTEFISNLKQLFSDKEQIIITIFAHSYIGHDRNGSEICGLALGNSYENFITWQEIIKIINDCRTKFPVILNLLTPCKSQKILDFICENDTIDKIWYSKVESPTIRYSIILTEEYQNFNQFCNDILSDEEMNNYGEYVK